MPLNAKAIAVLHAFGREPGVTSGQLKNLTDTINASPALIDEVNRAVDRCGDLRVERNGQRRAS